MAVGDNQQPTEKHVSNAVSAGYDGIEIDAGEGSSLEQALHEFQSPSLAISHMTEVLQATAKVIPTENIGIRFTPFAIVDGDYLSSLLTSYTALLEAIKLDFPSLGYVHFSGSRTFDDFEYAENKSLDPFRAVLTFPHGITEPATGPLFVSSNGYSADQAHETATRTNDLVCIGMASDGCPDIISLIRSRSSFRPAPLLLSRLSKVEGRFRQGKECTFGWDPDQMARVADAMNEIDIFLTEFHDSCWFSCNGLGQPLVQADAEVSKYDTDFAEEHTVPPTELQDFETRSSLAYLKHILDSTLLTTTTAIGLNKEVLDRCKIYYRLTKQTSPAAIKVPIHLHSHLLTATITSNPGVRVYDFAGALRQPGINGTTVMGGTTLYRWSEGKYLPTFHDVVKKQDSVTIEAVLNFTDKTEVPRNGLGFFHDVEQIHEENSSKAGDFGPMWDIIGERHRLGHCRVGCDRVNGLSVGNMLR